MKRLIKWLCVLASLVVLALVAGIVIITMMVNPNQFKPLIISQFKQFTGFEMTIPGNLSWSFYPNLGMQAEVVTVSDPSVFTAKMEQVVMRAKFAPLLNKQLHISKASIGNLHLNNLELNNVQAKIHFADQELIINPLSAELYQGDLKANATVNLQQASPDMHVVGKLNQVAIADFLKGLSGKAPKIDFDGRLNATWDVSTQGKSTDQLLSHLNGNSQFTVSNGVMKGIDLAYFVNTAVALVNKQALPSRDANNQTEFGTISGTAQIKDGVVSTDNLTLESSRYSAKATGTLNLVNNTLDYHLDVTSKVPESTNKVLALYGKTIPVRITGSLNSPSVTLDTLALMQEVGKEQLQKVGEEIQKAIPEKANNFIKSLFH